MAQDMIKSDTIVVCGQLALDLALAHFSRLRVGLEASHAGEYVRIDVMSGDHIVGATRGAVRADFKKIHGDRVAYTIPIG